MAALLNLGKRNLDRVQIVLVKIRFKYRIIIVDVLYQLCTASAAIGVSECMCFLYKIL
jgi:hypothetical protein